MTATAPPAHRTLLGLVNTALALAVLSAHTYTTSARADAVDLGGSRNARAPELTQF